MSVIEFLWSFVGGLSLPALLGRMASVMTDPLFWLALRAAYVTAKEGRRLIWALLIGVIAWAFGVAIVESTYHSQISAWVSMRHQLTAGLLDVTIIYYLSRIFFGSKPAVERLR